MKLNVGEKGKGRGQTGGSWVGGRGGTQNQIFGGGGKAGGIDAIVVAGWEEK